MFFERDYFVHYYDSDIKQRLTITGIMKYLEDIAILHSEDAKIGLEYYEQKKVAWVLHKWGIRINRYPKFKDTVRVRTRAVSLNGFKAYRYFDILDKGGNQIVVANSMWLFLNTETKRPIKINEDMFSHYHVDFNCKEELPIKEVPALTKVSAKKDFYIRYSDIDTNKHVNNIAYVNWAMELIPENIIREYTLAELNVIYKKETGLGRMMTSSIEIKDKKNEVECIHLISDNEKELCGLGTKWILDSYGR